MFFQRVHGGKGYGQRNREGEKILESVESLGLVLVSAFFNKNEAHLITYKSGGNSSQIDFIMTRRADLKEMRDCRRGGCISASAAMCSPEDKRSKT